MNRPRALLDTIALNDLADGHLDEKKLQNFELLVTHLQYDEISQIKDYRRKNEILSRVKKFEVIPTSGFVLGYSSLGQASLSAGDVYYKAYRYISSTQSNSRRKSKHQGNIRDAIIAETVIVQKMTLITSDVPLSHIVKKFGGTVLTYVRSNHSISHDGKDGSLAFFLHTV